MGETFGGCIVGECWLPMRRGNFDYRIGYCGYLFAMTFAGVVFNYFFTEGFKALDRCCSPREGNWFAQTMVRRLSVV